MTYNGWTNYETWCVALWLDNDQADRDDAAYELGQQIRHYVEDLAEATCPGCIEGASFVADLFAAALSECNYQEIAKNLLSEMVDA